MLFAQSTAGSAPLPDEQNIKTSPMNYRQSAIFADIQLWDLKPVWVDECGCGQAPGWTPDFSTDNSWEATAQTNPSWVITDIDPTNHIGCP